jgi:hypothetical protein
MNKIVIVKQAFAPAGFKPKLSRFRITADTVTAAWFHHAQNADQAFCDTIICRYFTGNRFFILLRESMITLIPARPKRRVLSGSIY